MKRSTKITTIIIIFFFIITAVIVARTLIGSHFQKKFGKRPPPGIIVTEVAKKKFSETIESFGTAISKKTETFRIKKDNLISEKSRVISGDVFTGNNVGVEGSLGFYHYQITAIPEQDEQEFLGWLLPGLNKYSNSRTFLSWIMPKRRYDIGTNMNGEERAYVVTGEYEKVLPMDIYPVQLIKAIMIEDIELMENLGIYEVSAEDFALCEFICTSKIPVQQIIQNGLDLIRKENQ